MHRYTELGLMPLNTLAGGSPRGHGPGECFEEGTTERPQGATVSGLNRKALAVAKPVYPTLAAHQRAEDSWNLHALAGMLDTWWGRIDEAFQLGIPRTPLRLERSTRRNCLGYFRPGHNEFGLQMEIALGVLQHTDGKGLDLGDLIGSLTHEALHLWQHLHGAQAVSRHNHHNREFRDKARSLGLVVDYRGHQTYALESPFLDLLRRQGAAPPRCLGAGSPLPGERARGASGRSKLKKWSCGCPQNAWVGAGEFRAVCPRCTRPFLRAH